MESQTSAAKRADSQGNRRSISLFPTAVALTLSACAWQSYAPDPLRIEEDFNAFSSARESGVPPVSEEQAGELTLDRAARWLRARGPGVRAAVAAYRTALAKAGIATPWPNPAISIGPEFGSGEDSQINKVVPFASLSLTIPLSGRLGKQDELNEAVAQSARADALATFRELYLDLRVRFVKLAVAQRREVVRASVLEAARDSVDVANELVVAGVATALDVSLNQLEYAREQSRLLGARVEAANAASDLSELVAVSPGHLGVLPDSALPALPKEVPNMKALQELVVEEHPGLLRSRAAYEVAERQLHLEITKQYPDLVLGPSYAGEVGERKTILGLSLGVAVPLFDRNQQAIAQATKRREQVRVDYEAEAHRILTAVERSRATAELASAQHRILRDEVLPAARDNVEIARQSLAAGAAGALQLLDAERSLRQIQVEVLEARLSEQIAWSDLEKAVGFPLVEFPSDLAGAGRLPPDELVEEQNKDEGEGR